MIEKMYFSVILDFNKGILNDIKKNMAEKSIHIEEKTKKADKSNEALSLIVEKEGKLKNWQSQQYFR